MKAKMFFGNDPIMSPESRAQLRAYLRLLARQARSMRVTQSGRFLNVKGKGSGDLTGQPCLAVMSDQGRLPRPDILISLLPRGSLFVFRDYQRPDRPELGRYLRALAARHQVCFFVAGDVALARRLGADGLHVPSFLLPKPGLWGGFQGPISAACHSRSALDKAQSHGADLAFVSPVLPTRSHRGEKSLGVGAFKSIAREARLPVFALGGLEPHRLQRLQVRNIQGLAGISIFAPVFSG